VALKESGVNIEILYDLLSAVARPQPPPRAAAFLLGIYIAEGSMGTIQPILPKGATATMPERFICPICGKEPTCKGFNNHLNRCLEKHNMTRDQYEKVHQETLY